MPIKNDYKALVSYGFSNAKALEICLDCKRGVSYASAILAIVKSQAKG